MPSATLERPASPLRERTISDLLVLWQHPETRELIPIGRFSRHDAGYSFAYTQAAAGIEGFRLLPGLPDLRRRHDSHDLPPVFTQRVMSSRRPDYDEYLSSLGLPMDATPWEQIVESGGSRAGDTLQFMPLPTVAGGRATARFFVNGIRHIPEADLRLPGRTVRITADEQEQAMHQLRTGSSLLMEPEQGNPEDDDAIVLTTAGIPVGWVPRVLSASLRPLAELGASVHVRRVGNSRTPSHVRLVVELDEAVDPNFVFDPDGRWSPLPVQ